MWCSLVSSLALARVRDASNLESSMCCGEAYDRERSDQSAQWSSTTKSGVRLAAVGDADRLEDVS